MLEMRKSIKKVAENRKRGNFLRKTGKEKCAGNQKTESFL